MYGRLFCAKYHAGVAEPSALSWTVFCPFVLTPKILPLANFVSPAAPVHDRRSASVVRCSTSKLCRKRLDSCGNYYYTANIAIFWQERHPYIPMTSPSWLLEVCITSSRLTLGFLKVNAACLWLIVHLYYLHSAPLSQSSMIYGR